MSEANCHVEIIKFHRQHVTLNNAQQRDMRNRRDTGRARLRNGLDSAENPQPKEIRSQGSYQMRTMVQDENNDYDIDDGAYFYFEDLKDSKGESLAPKEARQRVCDALKWDGRFRQAATVKKNCVRQVYAEGYHIDVPVYRIRESDSFLNDEEYFELASGDEWVKSDARAVTKWFNDLVGELNAGEADGSQLRRITKLSKKFARRTLWKAHTASGIAITKLVVDHFVCSTNRDDLSLRDTWRQIYNQLRWSTEINHPIMPTNISESRDEQVEFLASCLEEALDTLNVLEEYGCNRKAALEAWDEVFDTSFFSDQLGDENGKGSESKEPLSVTNSETARRDDGGGRFG